MKDTYITAVLQLLQENHDTEKLLSGLKSVLKERGHQQLLVPVLHGALRVLDSHESAGALVRVVSETDYKAQKETIQEALKALGATEEPTVIVDETIVGGYVAEHNRSRVDASYKSKLITLYRSLTK